MFNQIDELINEIKNGQMVILVDGEDRENEADIVFAAQFVDHKKIAFMIKKASGLICVPMEEDWGMKIGVDRISIHDQQMNLDLPSFAVGMDLREGIGSGISAHDRAKTILKMSQANAEPSNFIKPGHVFPLIAKAGGVLARPGHTEASLDLVKLSGLHPVAVICEILNEDGAVCRGSDLFQFAEKNKIKISQISQLIEYMKNKA